MNNTIQLKILNSLLNKYERSTFFREGKPPTRRIMLDFYNGGKSDFPYYDIEQSDRRISVNQAVIDLAEERLLCFDWMKGEHGHIIAQVWLNTDNLSSAYQAAKLEPKGDIIDRILLEIANTQRQVESAWACSFLQDMYDTIARKRSMVSAIPTDDEERKLLLQVIVAIDNFNGAEYTERLFSLQTLGDSKRFEHSVKSRLVSILRKHLDNDDDATADDILKQVGIVKYPEQFEFCGNISIAFEFGCVNFHHLQSGGVIYSSDLSSGNILIDPSIESILTIENRANYIEYIRKIKTEKELVIYHGGQYSPRKRKFLRAIAKSMLEGCKWYHWSDIDYGGFIMLSRLRQEIIHSVIPYRMNSRELEHYNSFVTTMKTSYAKKLQKLKAHPELSDCYDCIDYMLKNKVRLEQEAMLTDS